jgi:hypothetical protein
VVPLLLIPAVLLTQTTFAQARGVHPPRRGAYVGAWVNPSDWSVTGWKRAVTGLESRIGHRLDVVQYYYTWQESFPTERERWQLNNRRIPLISWNGANTDAIRRGSYDALIRSRADAVRRLRKPVFIRWNWEMDRGGSTIPSPASYVAAWRHIVRIFRDRGATNASFVWCPTAYGFSSGLAQRYWPGGSYVDWTCADGYNWYPGRNGSRWTSFREVFHAFYTWAKRRHRPMIVGEFGVQEDPRHAGRKAEWIADAKRTLKNDYRKIKAVTYFNADRVYDWRLTSSSSALRAFGNMARDPYFN